MEKPEIIKEEPEQREPEPEICPYYKRWYRRQLLSPNSIIHR